MPLSEDDVREILRLIDGSAGDLHVETPSFSLDVLRDSEDSASTGPVAADGLLTIAAPILGTFYRAQAPGAPPYVEVGSHVDADTVVGLIEVMKMMNPVPAGLVGTIVEVCADNAAAVEYGAPLFHVEPA